MKHEQVVPNYIVMLESSITVLALVGCGWILFKLVSACIWFPQYMKNLEIEADKANAYLEKTLLPKTKSRKVAGSKAINENGEGKLEDNEGNDRNIEQASETPTEDDEPKKDK